MSGVTDNIGVNRSHGLRIRMFAGLGEMVGVVTKGWVNGHIGGYNHDVTQGDPVHNHQIINGAFFSGEASRHDQSPPRMGTENRTTRFSACWFPPAIIFDRQKLSVQSNPFDNSAANHLQPRLPKIGKGWGMLDPPKAATS